MTQVLKNLDIAHQRSTAYHHQTVGSLEHTHNSLGAHIRAYAKTKADWDKWLPHFAFAYNTTVNSATSYSPFELLFGRLARRPSDLPGSNVTPPQHYDDYITKLQYALHRAYEDVRQKSVETKQIQLNKTKTGATNVFQVGDKVYLERGNRKKLDSVRPGPFQVTEIAHPNVTIARQGETQTVHASRITLVWM